MPSIIKEKKIQAFVKDMVEYVSKQIIEDATQSKKMCEVVISDVVRFAFSKYPNVHIGPRDGSLEPYVSALLYYLKERFPNCAFTQDPAKKYVFVDWT
jgi:hypothetical protein